MPENITPKAGERMDETDVKLLQAIHGLDKKIVNLETKIDESINGRFKDHERRLNSLESNERWFILAFLGAIIAAIMKSVIK